MSTQLITHHLDDVLAALNRHQQRATYSAVAALIGEAPRALMRGKSREPRNSWIVSKTTSMPTGYTDAEMHPALTANATVLRTREALVAWLDSLEDERSG